jgi:hypothetical protein
MNSRLFRPPSYKALNVGTPRCRKAAPSPNRAQKHDPALAAATAKQPRFFGRTSESARRVLSPFLGAANTRRIIGLSVFMYLADFAQRGGGHNAAVIPQLELALVRIAGTRKPRESGSEKGIRPFLTWTPGRVPACRRTM